MKRFLSALLLTLISLTLWGQNITGQITDIKTGEPLPYVNIHYDGKAVGVNSDYEGRYSIVKINGATLTFSYVGYEKQTVRISSETRVVNIKLKSSEQTLQTAVVTAKRRKYTRKNNPAVEFMRKVIAAKKESDYKLNDYFSYQQYRKTTLSINEFTDKVYSDANFKNMPFLKNHVEVCPETGKRILPVSVTEELSRYVYRKQPESEKTIIEGKREEGVNQLLQTGDILNALIQDCFTDVDIYKENVRLLQYPFVSPVSTHFAIAFYHYFLADTLMVGNDRCIQVDFSPANPQDFGFTGSLYVMADTTYRIRKVLLNIPRRSAVNYEEDLKVDQEFITLPSGEQLLASDKMIVQLKLASFLTKFQVERSTYYSDYSTSDIPKKDFKFLGPQYTDPKAMMRDQAFWQEKRPVKLSSSEDKIGQMITEMQNMKHFKAFLWVAKAFIENFVETSTNPEKPSKVDIGPVNTMISQNFVDGLRLRFSAQTTANLNPHWFLSGYYARGWDSKKNYYKADLTYSFNKKEYLPREFPRRTLSFTSTYDVCSPSDKFVHTDKDNVFTSFKWSNVEKMMFYNRQQLTFEREEEWGFKTTFSFKTEQNEACGDMFFTPVREVPTAVYPDNLHHGKIRTTELHGELRFAPGETFINTKQRRIKINLDAPVFTIGHTIGIKGLLGGEYAYHVTEASIYKRFWMNSWGKIDCYLKGGIQWTKVPFPLLIAPASNLSYIIEDETFNLINNMEFLNDRYASLDVSWDLNGKIFNRIPLLKKLKWREYLGVKCLWGELTDKNNPNNETYAGSVELMAFPEGCYVMDPKRPYVEVIAGIHNIFKILHVEYVQRLNYTSLPTAQKRGVRMMVRMTF